LNIPDDFEYIYTKNIPIIERRKNTYSKIKTVPRKTAQATAVSAIQNYED
jgi:hypothetical protein